MTIELENDSSRDFLDAVLGLRRFLARVRVAGDGEEAESLNADDPAVLLLLGLHSVERKLNRWISSLDDPEAIEHQSESFSKTERLMR